MQRKKDCRKSFAFYFTKSGTSIWGVGGLGAGRSTSFKKRSGFSSRFFSSLADMIFFKEQQLINIRKIQNKAIKKFLKELTP